MLPELFKKKSILNRQTIHRRAISVTGLAGVSRRWIFRIYSRPDCSWYFDFCLHQNCASFACLIKSNQLSHNPHLSEAYFTLVRTTAACGCFILCSLHRQVSFTMVWKTITEISYLQSNTYGFGSLFSANFTAEHWPWLCYHFAPVNGKSVVELFEAHGASIMLECCSYRFELWDDLPGHWAHSLLRPFAIVSSLNWEPCCGQPM